jgi:hypothetical protein
MDAYLNNKIRYSSYARDVMVDEALGIVNSAPWGHPLASGSAATGFPSADLGSLSQWEYYLTGYYLMSYLDMETDPPPEQAEARRRTRERYSSEEAARGIERAHTDTPDDILQVRAQLHKSSSSFLAKCPATQSGYK